MLVQSGRRLQQWSRCAVWERRSASHLDRRACRHHNARRPLRPTPIARVAPPTHPFVRQAPPAPPPAARDLPASVRDATAVLAAPSSTVYIIGVSHVSSAACAQIRDLVGAVKPEVVVVELCKDRTGLLVDPETTAKAPDTWICTRVEFDGIPGSSGGKDDNEDDDKKGGDDGGEEKSKAADALAADASWPKPAELSALLRTRIGRPITTAEVEGDVAALEATGLFARVRPICEPARRGDAPMFGAMKAEAPREGLELEYVAPLGSTCFVVEPRALPAIKSMGVRLDSSLKDAGVAQARLDEVAAGAVAACASEPPRAALLAYLVARRELIDAVEGSDGYQRHHQNQQQQRDADGDAPANATTSTSTSGSGSTSHPIVVDFSGVDTGNAEAVVRARRPGDADAPFVSGLESSAEGGEGQGIDRFRPVKRGVQLSPRMSLPAEAAARMNALKAAKRAGAAMTARGGAAEAGR